MIQEENGTSYPDDNMGGIDAIQEKNEQRLDF